MSEIEHEAASGRELAGDEMRYRHVIGAVYEKPWAILPRTLAVIVDLVSYRSRGVRLTQAEIEDRISEGQTTAAARRQSNSGSSGAVAVLPLFGVIAPRASMVNSVSGPAGTGVDAFTKMFRQALADPAVGSILIEVDSPGGRVDLVPELAAEIRQARGDKPIVAIANSMAASAAYWIASQCDEIVVTPSGEVGSVGVYCAHQDLSAALEQEGVKVTLISAGKFKTEGNPFEPLSQDAKDAIQADVDTYYSMFTADVAKGRGVSAANVRDGFGQGRMVTAREAVKAGMADRVATFDDTVRRLASGTVTAGRKAELAAGGLTANDGMPTLIGEHGPEQVIPLGNSARRLNVEIGADTTALDAALVKAYVTSNLAAIEAAGLSVTEALDMNVNEIEAAIAAAHEDPEGGLPSNLELVDGAERLLAHAAVREAFTPGPNTN